MMKRTFSLRTSGVAVLVGLSLAPAMQAQGPPAAPPPALPVVTPAAGPACPAPEPCEQPATHKVPHAVVQPVPHTRICYDVKEEEFCKTCGARTPIVSTKCPCHDKHAGKDE